MWGAIAGDVIGSRYEFNNTSDYGFALFGRGATFTDDTVLTVAVAAALTRGEEFGKVFRRYGLRYPGRGYGSSFSRWLAFGDGAYGLESYGNGAAMRVSPVGWYAQSLGKAEEVARLSAMPSHAHPEGIKGAETTAGAVFLAKTGACKAEILAYVEGKGYEVPPDIRELHPYPFDETCQGTVPVAVRAFLDSNDFESAIRLAVWVGGDVDTIAAITGGIAEAYYDGGVPSYILSNVHRRLPREMKETIRLFRAVFKKA